MRVSTPQIAFHQRDGGKNDPILSVDLHPFEDIVATAGSDNEIKLWTVEKDKEEGSPFIFLTALVAHAKSVNAVRFSPSGVMLASCSDEGRVCIQECDVESICQSTPAIEPQSPPPQQQGQEQHREESRKENGRAYWSLVREEKHVNRKYLRGHSSDVVDLAWSKDSSMLVSGAIDGAIILWDVETGKMLSMYQDHGHYVQGICWDPFQHFFCSESADQSIRLYKAKRRKASNKQKKKTGKPAEDSEAPAEESESMKPLYVAGYEITKRSFTVTVQNNSNDENENSGNANENKEGSASSTTVKKKTRQIFLDDSVATFYRRPAWSPDGLILVAPTGQFRGEKSSSIVPTTYVFFRGSWQSPALHLPGASKASVAVRFSPVLFKLRADGVKPWLDVPYRMVFAVATLDSVFIYDTQHGHPIGVAEQLHLAQITDLCWTSDGQGLVVSSNDGYCSVLSMGPDEIGQTLSTEELPEILQSDKPPFLNNVSPTCLSPPVSPLKSKRQVHVEQEQEKEGEADKASAETRVTSEHSPPPAATQANSSKRIRRIVPENLSGSVVLNEDSNSSTSSCKRRIRPEIVAVFESPQQKKRELPPPSFLTFPTDSQSQDQVPQQHETPSPVTPQPVPQAEQKEAETIGEQPKKKRRVQLTLITPFCKPVQ